MNRVVIVTVLLWFSGCGTKLIDPCAHQAGACLAVHIDSSAAVSRLSSAQLRITGEMLDVSQSVGLENGASATDLPVALAIVFPNFDTPADVHIDIVGVLNGSPIGEAAVSAMVIPGQHGSVHVQLDRIGNESDGGSGDDMASTDLAGYIPLTVQLAGTGTGTVTGSGISCSGTTCSGQYPPHTMVTLAASAATNASFAGWSGGGCVGMSTCVVTLDAATTVTATFDWRFVPSHAPMTAYDPSAGNLSSVTAIDTHNLTINGGAPPTGVTFGFNQGNAVLSIGGWNVTANVTITGDAPLIVVAAGAVSISPGVTINASAVGTTPGPGGNLGCSLAGTGVAGQPMQSGGGGNFSGGASPGGQPAGGTYGLTLADFCGGAKGGEGGRFNCQLQTACVNAGHGGGGGGALQISSATSITIQGAIAAAGGGGDVGYYNSGGPLLVAADAGGGGSGGEIFLEAPQITLANAVLQTDGGGGAGPRSGSLLGSPGTDGTSASPIGGAGGDTTANPPAVGGTGAFLDGNGTLDPATTPNPPDTGGGGGGWGRIWMRTRATMPDLSQGKFSPAPMIDKTL